MIVALALVPTSITTSSDFSSHKLPHDGVNCKCPKPYIKLPTPRPRPWCPPSKGSHPRGGITVGVGDSDRGQTKNNNGTVIIGKQQLIQTCSSACGCLKLVQVPCNKKREVLDTTTTHGSRTNTGHQSERKGYKSCYRISDKCKRCNDFQAWALKFISSKMISIQQLLPSPGTGVTAGVVVEVRNMNTTESESAQHAQVQTQENNSEQQEQSKSSSSWPSWRVEMIGMNPKIVFVNGQELRKGKDHAVIVHEGCEISFRNPLRHTNADTTTTTSGQSDGKCSTTSTCSTTRTKAPDDAFVIFRICQVLEKKRNKVGTVVALQGEDSCTASEQLGNHDEFENENIDEGLTQREGMDVDDGEEVRNDLNMDSFDRHGDKNDTQSNNQRMITDKSGDMLEDDRVEKENNINPENAMVKGEGGVNTSIKLKEGNADGHSTKVRLDRSKTPRISNVIKESPTDARVILSSVPIMGTNSNNSQNESNGNGVLLEEQCEQLRSFESAPVAKTKPRNTDKSEVSVGKDEKMLHVQDELDVLVVENKGLGRCLVTTPDCDVDMNEIMKLSKSSATNSENPISEVNNDSTMSETMLANISPAPNASDAQVDLTTHTSHSKPKLCRTGSDASNAIEVNYPKLCRAGTDASNAIDVDSPGSDPENTIDLVSPERSGRRIMTDTTNSNSVMEYEWGDSCSPEEAPSQPLHIPAKHTTSDSSNVMDKAKQVIQTSSKVADVINLASDDSQSQTSATMMKINPIHAAYFLPLGKTMSKSRIKILSQSLKRRDPNLMIQTEFNKSSMPKFIVVDAILTLEAVQSALDFDSLIEMRRYSEDVFFVKPGWVNEKGNLHSPAMDQCWVNAHGLKKRKKNCDDSLSSRSHDSSGGWLKKMRRTHEFAPITKISAAAVNNPVIDYLHTRKKNMNENGVIDVQMTNQKRNLELSKLLSDISRVYKECPLEKHDNWRSYSYNRCAGRLLYLNFDVTSDEQSLNRLRKIPGFGDKMVKHVS